MPTTGPIPADPITVPARHPRKAAKQVDRSQRDGETKGKDAVGHPCENPIPNPQV